MTPVREIRIRSATLDDAAGIAEVHVASWRWAYTGLLPQAAIDQRTFERRLALHQAFYQSIHRPKYALFIAFCEAVRAPVTGFSETVRAQNFLGLKRSSSFWSGRD